MSWGEIEKEEKSTGDVWEISIRLKLMRIIEEKESGKL